MQAIRELTIFPHAKGSNSRADGPVYPRSISDEVDISVLPIVCKRVKKNGGFFGSVANNIYKTHAGEAAGW